MKLCAGCGPKKIGAKAVGVDISLDYIRKSKALSPGARYVVADITNLPFKDGAFVEIECADVLEHLPCPGRGIAEIARVSARGAIVRITVGLRDGDKLLGAINRAYRRIITEGYHRHALSGPEYITLVSERLRVEKTHYAIQTYWLPAAILLMHFIPVEINEAGEFVGEGAARLDRWARACERRLQPLMDYIQWHLPRRFSEKLARDLIIYATKDDG